MLCPIAWAIGGAILKFMRSNFLDEPGAYLVFTVPSVLLSLVLIFFEPFIYPGIRTMLICIGAGLAGVISYYLFIASLKHEELSRVIILYAVNPIFVLSIAFFFLGEVLGVRDYIAFALIISGSLMICMNRGSKFFRLSRGMAMVLFSSFFGAVHNVLLKTVAEANFTTIMLMREAGIAAAIIAVAAFSGSVRRAAFRMGRALGARNIILAYTAEFFGLAGVVFAYIAMQAAPVSMVSLIQGLEPLFVILIALVLSRFFPGVIKEEFGKKTITIKIASAALMIGGLYFIIR